MLSPCLIVDDHEMIRDTIGLMAQALGIKSVITAEDGAEAISKAYHEAPNLIITDLQMDPIDGLEMLRLMRSGRYHLRHDTPIIILTANASQAVISECIRYDVDAFMVKPVKKQDLENRVKQLSKQTKAKKPPTFYFEMYQSDPAKSTEFEHNGVIVFTEEEQQKIKGITEPQNEAQPHLTPKEPSIAPHKEESKDRKFIRWQEKYTVGHPSLDESNKQLLSIINDTYEAIAYHHEDETKTDFEALAQRFRDYIDSHFQLEEDILEARAYPKYKAHAAIHQRLARQAQYVLLQCQADPELYRSEFFKFLRYWWIHHVVREDTQYRDFLLQGP
ncbi:bacteriohemerythrin [Salinivibrio kushneri]|uniref:bacteriohemerythrin n=1 Tax=Salinivibrio kushneri TaxID=1908198 RepID=UPI000985DF39|nr:bacteriohemerythrin [Salinivibrio kushneri]OOE42753.1 two-component system response regulator [Salinivibrio kushneri]OOE49994.1 two-component system response regulator [Salinivibrio kushneri]OOE54598.1 two-component system response regulator [Salinivibrio kushneri]OOE61576.1 two-component system response regulator [Salinivibrio kushneri]